MDRGTALSTVSPPTHSSPVLAPVPSLQQVFRQNASFVASLAHRLIGRNDEIDDVVQDVFLAAVRGMSALRDANAIRHWLATVSGLVRRRRT